MIDSFLCIGLSHYLVVSGLLFTIGAVGFMINRRNILILMMSIELILLSVTLNFVAFSVYWQNLAGQVFTFFVLTVAAAEAAIGLAILVIYFRNRTTIEIDDAAIMKG